MAQERVILISVSLAEDVWRVILAMVEHTCRKRGGDWIEWQQRLSQIVLHDIEEAKSRRQTATPKRDISSDEWEQEYLDDLSDALQAMEDGEPVDWIGRMVDQNGSVLD